MKQIELETKEFYELMEFFEKTKIAYGRYERESQDNWNRQIYYEDGNINECFKMFLAGCNYGIMVSR